MSVIGGSRGQIKLNDFDPSDSTNLAKRANVVDYSGDNGTKGTVVTDRDGAGGGVVVTMDGTDNDCETIYHGGEMVDPNDTGTEFGFRAAVTVTEADAGDASIFVGMSDITGATLLGDTGALATGDHLGFHVLGANESGGSAFWRTVIQNATANSGETTSTAYAAATEYILEVKARVFVGGITAKFYINGTLVDTVTGFSTTSYGEMHPMVIGITTNGANADVITVRHFSSYCFKS